MTVDRPFESFQDAGSPAHTILSTSNSVPNELDGAFDFFQLEGKDAPQQLAILTHMMVHAVSIKEGAEAMLHGNSEELPEALRQQVLSELNTAEGRIEIISHRLEQHRRAVDDKDDFRTILQQARGHVRTLISLSRTVTSPSASPGSPTTPQSTSLHDPETTRTRVDVMTKLIGLLQRNLRVQYELDIVQVAHAVIPALSKRSTQLSRATAYRLVRHMLVDMESVKRFHEQPLDWLIVRSLTLDNKHAVEKEQVIKLIRTIVAIGSQKRGSSHASLTGTVPLSERVMRAFIAIAEQPDDPFRFVAIQTLAEILLIDARCVANAGGMRVLLQTLTEGPPALASLLNPAFLYILDSPSTRKHLRPGKDLEVALSGITDAYGKDSERQQRLKDTCRSIVCMLRTWSGLMYFCMNDMRAIKSLIDTLRIPSFEPREIVLDMFFELLNIKTPAWYKAFISGRRLTVYRKSRQASEPNGTDTEVQQRQPEPLRLTDQYIALLVLIFIRSGLLEALTCMFQETTSGSNLSRKGTLLMAEILQLANKVLPLSLAAKIQLVPEVFKLASDYRRGEHRIIGTSALSSIDSFNRNRTRLETGVVSNRPRANSVEDAIRRGQRQVEQVRIKMGLQMDDKTFQAALLESQVTLTKDHSKWNFETLQDLIEGPLLNPKRMEEAIKLSRFLRRLMNFFHPFSHRFSDIERNKINMRWVKLGCTLLTTLLASPDGQRFLTSEDDLLNQLTRSFAQLDPFNGAPESDPIFSKKRVSDTLTYGYLEMLGTLSKNEEGIKLMEKAKLFTAFYHLSELRSREDLIKGIIENIDYSIDGHPRIVLSKALTSSYKHIRLYATKHLGEMILHSPTANTWTLRLLLTQLYDPAMEVCQMATQFLEEACELVDILQLVVAMQPTLDHLGDVGHGLLLKFMSTPVGFRYLFDSGYIDREMEIWFHERNIHYVVEIEVWLAKTMEFMPIDDDDDDDIPSFDGVVPPHFYGEMAKTELGCQTLQEKGHFSEFALFIRQHGHEKEDPELILKLKSILWTVGNIGSSADGLPFLEDEDIIPVILEIAEQSQVLSVRGTCFFVLGLISSTPQGAEILSDYGWEATLSPLGFPTGLCVPLELDKFLLIPPWDPAPSSGDLRLIPPESQAEIEVTTAISNLSNTVIAATASRSLAKLKSRPEYQSVFTSVPVFYRALHMISTSRYRLPVRRYVFDLFDIDLDEDVLRQLGESEKALALAVSKAAPPQPNARVVSVLFAAPRTHATESDEEDEPPPVPQHGPPVINLRPRSTIVGFSDD